VQGIYGRVNVAGGAPVFSIENSTASTAFSVASTPGTVTFSSGAYEASATGLSGPPTVASGNKLRFNVTTLGTATGWTITVLLQQQ
jgi:hypothetical protein